MVRERGRAAPEGALHCWCGTPTTRLALRELSDRRSGSSPSWASGLSGMGSRSTRQDATRRLPAATGRSGHPETIGHDVRLSRLHPCVGAVAEGQERGAASDGEGPLPRALAAVATGAGETGTSRSATSTPTLPAMMQGHCAYYGISGNTKRMRWYHHQVERIWRKWLRGANGTASCPGRASATS